ncbi:beta-glucoside-specific PTS transporter subunit IIABC [Pectinatus sottacetonis]|uniref:beta-glucoside-specific PTS transporter subunit IIABC n=1 Tax=Pectinatus sottacetonis TaxID=1002795 RepID=UPI0018C6439F|nr:beta-glucoside-specific PTS transporter subunit IIABC [Pectinatus sottacetonis]
MQYHSLASNILNYMGGDGNVKKVWHCATRLRFNLVDDSKVNKDKLEELDGVIQVIFGHEQWQIVIGTQVGSVYHELMGILNIKDGNEPNQENNKKQKGIFGLINKFIAFISSLFMPFLGAICGAGVLKGILALCITMNWLNPKSGGYILLNAASDSLFYFLPIFIAFTAAKQLKVDRFVSISIAGVLVYPSIIKLATDHITLSFFGIPVIPMAYTSSVIPIILAIWVLSYLDVFLNKIIPNNLKYVFVALIELVIMVPLTLIVVGPIGSTISNMLAGSIMGIYDHAAIFAGIFIGGLWQVIVIFGFHWMILPLIMSNIAKMGQDPIFPIACAAVLSQAGAALGVFFRTKDKKMRQVSGSAFVAAIFGITEPTLYGVTLKFKKPFYIAIGSSAIGGAIIGMSGVYAHAFAFPSILSIPTYLGHGFLGEIAGLLVSFILAAVLTYLFGLPAKNVDSTTKKITEKLIIPVEGEKLPLSEVKDKVFSSGQMGQGIAIRPNSNEILAPVSGEVTATFDSKHAIGITDELGTQILIHVGIDTVNLQGKYFKYFAKKGDKIKQGQKLIEFDNNSILQEGYDTTVILIILNSNEYNIAENYNKESTIAIEISKL